MRFTRENVILNLLLIISVLVAPLFLSKPETPSAASGIIDLRKQDFNKEIPLKGEWRFQLIEKHGDTIQNPESQFLTVPENWDALSGTPYAAGVYSLKILLPEDIPETGDLIFPELSQIIEVKLNGRHIHSSGNFKDGTTDFTQCLLQIPLKPELNLTIHIKNTKYRHGGLIYLPSFSSHGVLTRVKRVKLWGEAFYLGILFFVAVYHIFLYLKDQNSDAALYLGFASFIMIVRALVTGENTITLLMPEFSWELDYRLEYISVYLGAGVILRFSNRILPLEHKAIDFVDKLCIPFTGLLSLITLFLPIYLLSNTIYIMQIVIFLSLILSVIIYFSALKNNKEYAYLFFLGGLAAIVCFITDAVYFLGIWNMPLNFTQIGMLVFILVQSLVLSSLYGDAFLRAERLTHSLEEEVESQVAKLKKTNSSLHEEILKRKKTEKKLNILASTDPLTGAVNRLQINSNLKQSYKIFQRYNSSFGLIMLDIDYFKKINDTFGHPTGDKVLKQIVQITKKLIRDSDILSRWGGEEFIILMPMMKLKGTALAAEKIRSTFENTIFDEAGNVTASFGIAVPKDKNESLEDLLIRLDEKLYQAKDEGRNRVAV